MVRIPPWECPDFCEWEGSYACFETNECLSRAEVELKDYMRLLWEEHIYWTRMTIISIAFDLPDLDLTTKRLLRNAKDFEEAFTPFYGNRIAANFGRLIKDHLVIAAQLVKAAKANDSKTAADAEKRWYANADEIACFLHSINPCWTEKVMREMWHEHLALTKAEAVARLNKDYAKDISIFEDIEKQALVMADHFTDGLVRQLPAI